MGDKYLSLLSSNYLALNCLGSCPLECNRTRFKAFLSSYDVIGDFFYDYIQSNANLLSDYVKANLTIATAKDSFTFTLVYYESMSYTLVTETPTMDLVALLANIGGTLGLFLGVSLLHVCEVIDVIIQIFLIKTNLIKSHTTESN
jgi:hypothetical protein